MMPDLDSDGWWEEQTKRSPARYQAWSTGRYRALLASNNRREDLLSLSFTDSYPHRTIVVLDTSETPGLVVAWHKAKTENKPFRWYFYAHWKPEKPTKPEKIPKKVTKLREQLAIVRKLLGAKVPSTPGWIAQEIGVRESQLDAVLAHGRQGYFVSRRGSFPLPEVAVRCVRHGRGWKIEPIVVSP